MIAALRKARADLAFTSDFIVGFPGESEDDFRETLTLVDEAGLAGAYSFTYSARPGTPAAEMDQVPAEAEGRTAATATGRCITRRQHAFNAAFAGRTLDVLLEKPGKLAGQLVGRSPYLQAVNVMAPRAMIGSLAQVIITEIGTNTLFGALTEDTPVPQLAAAGA